MSPESGDVQRAPPLPVRQPNVSSEFHQQFHQLQVAIDDRLMQRRLSLGPEGVDVKLAVGHVLEQRMELFRVALLHRLLEDSLRSRARRYIPLAHDALHSLQLYETTTNLSAFGTRLQKGRVDDALGA